MTARQDEVLSSLVYNYMPGRMELINRSGNQWKSIPDKIKAGKKIESIYHPEWSERFMEEMEQDYLNYFEDIRKEDKELQEIVSNFLGRVLVDYFFASKKK